MVFLVSLLLSIFITLIVIRYSLARPDVADSQMAGPQKFHALPVPRIGGLGIFITMVIICIGCWWFDHILGEQMCMLMLCSLPAFGSGIIEDVTKRVSPLQRLLACAVAAWLAAYFFGSVLNRVDIDWVNQILSYGVVAIIFTMFAVSGICNAVNIIDGFNGLAGFVTVMMFASLAYVAFQLGDQLVFTLALAMAGAVLGFLVWNFPLGLIFLGDGGAYFIGFMLAQANVLLVARHPEVSPWYCMLLLIYPIFETLFSIYRRKFLRGSSPSAPDGVHLHQMIFRRVIRWAVGSRSAAQLTLKNSRTSPYLWGLSAMAVLPATVFWNQQWWLIGFLIVFCVTYTWLYARIVRFKTPKWLISRREKAWIW